MANPEHFSAVRSGQGFLTRWRSDHPDVRLDLSGSDLRFASLESVDLSGADLRGALLAGSDLSDANLFAADLSESDLTDASLRYATLKRARLNRALLSRTDLEGSSLEGCDLSRAAVGGTGFRSLDLRNVSGLLELRHLGPSDLGPTGGTSTLQKSHGLIPELFLKGCGLQDWEILASKLHSPDLRPDEVVDIAYAIADVRAGSPITPFSIFISYSRQDQAFVEKLEGRFDRDGIRSWRDMHDMLAGPVEIQVDRAIGLSKAMLVVLSESSVESDWFEWEVEKARLLERDNLKRSHSSRHILCPVALDSSWKTASLRTSTMEYLLKYNILDFDRWSVDKYFDAQYLKLRDGLGIYYSS